MAKYLNPYPHISPPPSQEVRLVQMRSASGDSWWSYQVKIVLGKKIIEAGSTCHFGSLEDADKAAEAFIQDVLKVLVHGEGAHANP